MSSFRCHHCADLKSGWCPEGAAPLSPVWAINSSTAPRGTLGCLSQALPGDCGKTLIRGGEWDHPLPPKTQMLSNTALAQSSAGETAWTRGQRAASHPQTCNCKYYRQYFPNLWKTGSYLLVLTFHCYKGTHHGLYYNLLTRGRPDLAQQNRHLIKITNFNRGHSKKLTLFPGFGSTCSLVLLIILISFTHEVWACSSVFCSVADRFGLQNARIPILVKNQERSKVTASLALRKGISSAESSTCPSPQKPQCCFATSQTSKKLLLFCSKNATRTL